MSEHERTTPELKAFEALLAGLEPAAPKLDRDRLMYEAGRAAADGGLGRRGWPAATICVGLVALVVGRWTALPDERAPNVAAEQRPAVGSIAGANRITAPADSWVHLRTSIVRGEPAAVNPSPVAGLPPEPQTSTETWLEERRALLEGLN
jgi:hypothetical protein